MHTMQLDGLVVMYWQLQSAIQSGAAWTSCADVAAQEPLYR